MGTYYIDPTATAAGNGTLQNPYNSWSQVSWQAGSTYLQKAETIYSGTVLVLGSNDKISSYGTGATPQIGGAYFYGATNDSITNFTIRNNSVADIVFTHSSTHNNVNNCNISGGQVGVLFATGAGANNYVSGNNIHDNKLFGVDVAQGTLGEYLLNNSICYNGSHGVELEGNGTTVLYNNIYDNSTSIPGSSGIHTYVANSQVDGGNNNVIAYDIVSGTHDNGSGDGNGIEIDQWTHGNLVVGNISYQNDGAGIVVYGAHNNQLMANVLFSNQKGNYSTHGIHGELDFNSQPNYNDPNYGNTISMNILDSTSDHGSDLYFDSNSFSNQLTGTNFLAGSSGTLTNSQLGVATFNWFHWWSAQGVPSTLQGTDHAALQQMISF